MIERRETDATIQKVKKKKRIKMRTTNKQRETACETSCPTLTMSWIKEVEIATSIDDLMMSQSTEVKDFPDFEMLDVKTAFALRKILSNSNFRRRVSVEEQRAQKPDRFLRGGQIAYMIYDHFRATGAYDAAQGPIRSVQYLLT